MRNMTKSIQKLLILLGGLVVGVLCFLALFAFLVSDSCLDSGGAVGSSPFVCLAKNGEILPWFAVVKPHLAILSFTTAVFPVLIAYRIMLRKYGAK
jgi:hypothetical protein